MAEGVPGQEGEAGMRALTRERADSQSDDLARHAMQALFSEVRRAPPEVVFAADAAAAAHRRSASCSRRSRRFNGAWAAFVAAAQVAVALAAPLLVSGGVPRRAQVNARIASTDRDLRRSMLTQKEVEALPEDVRTFQAVGKAFILQDRDSMKAILKEDAENAVALSKTLKVRAPHPASPSAPPGRARPTPRCAIRRPGLCAPCRTNKRTTRGSTRRRSSSCRS